MQMQVLRLTRTSTIDITICLVSLVVIWPPMFFMPVSIRIMWMPIDLAFHRAPFSSIFFIITIIHPRYGFLGRRLRIFRFEPIKRLVSNHSYVSRRFKGNWHCWEICVNVFYGDGALIKSKKNEACDEASRLAWECKWNELLLVTPVTISDRTVINLWSKVLMIVSHMSRLYLI